MYQVIFKGLFNILTIKKFKNKTQAEQYIYMIGYRDKQYTIKKYNVKIS